MKDLLTEYGIKLPDLVAGFAGGVVRAFVLKRSNPLAIVGSVVVGAITAAYLGPPAGRWLGSWLGTTEGAPAFIVGLCGMALCQRLLEGVKRVRLPHGGLPNG
jgi:ABC-type xylose transport system permease subunit